MTTFAKTILAATATATLALGVAAPAAAQSWGGYDRGWHDNDRGWGERGWDGRGWDRRDGRGERFAAAACTRAATRDAARLGAARVTGIDDIDWTRDGFRVRGEIVVRNDRWGGWNRGPDFDRGRFTCRIDRGRVVDIDYRGLRGL